VATLFHGYVRRNLEGGEHLHARTVGVGLVAVEVNCRRCECCSGRRGDNDILAVIIYATEKNAAAAYLFRAVGDCVAFFLGLAFGKPYLNLGVLVSHRELLL
jgi:hypothetical protein